MKCSYNYNNWENIQRIEGVPQDPSEQPKAPIQQHQYWLWYINIEKQSQMKKRMGSKDKIKNCYDPFKSPPNYEKAKEHRKAWQVGVPKRGRKKRCECCMYPLDKQFFDLRCTHAQLAHLGASLAFYFEAIQIAVILLLVHLLVALMGRILNSCMPALVFSSSTLLGLVLSTSAVGQWYVVLWLCMMVGCLLVRKHASRELYNYESENYSQSSFALQLFNLPNCEEYQIKKWVVSHCGTEPLYIEIAYDIREWIEAFSKREELTILKNKLLQSQVDQDQSQDYGQSSVFINLLPNPKKTDLREVEAEIQKADQTLNKYRIHSSLTQEKQLGIAFVVFDSVKVVADFLMKIKSKKDYRLNFKEKIVTVEKAPNPRDIIWQHLANDNKQQSQRASVLGLCGGGLLLVLVCYYLRKVSHFYQIFEHSALTYFVILVVYALYHLSSHFLVQLEIRLSKCQTFTSQKMVAFRTYSVLNVLLAVTLPYSLQTGTDNLVLLINFVLFLDAFSHPLIKAFNLTHFSRKLMGEYIKKLESSKNVYTQDYLNRLLEGTKFRLGQNYHYIIRALLLSSFYAYAAPLSLFYYSISIIIEAIVQKYLLCRICKTPPKHSSKLANTFVDCLSLVPLFLTLGCLFYRIKGEQTQIQDLWLNMLCLLLSLCFAWFYAVFLRSKTQQFQENQNYYSVKQKLGECYKWENPIKRFNGELFNKFAGNRQREVSPLGLVEETPDRSGKSMVRERETVENARFKMMNRMSLINDMYDIHHLNDEYKKVGES